VRGVAADHLRLQQFLSATDKFETRLVKGAHGDDVDAWFFVASVCEVDQTNLFFPTSYSTQSSWHPFIYPTSTSETIEM